MIEKIKSEIEKLTDGYEHSCVDNAYQRGVSDGAKWIKKKALEIVQEVATEYGYCRKLNRCDTCNHYVADEVPPICYFCCKGMEDNFEQKGE